MEPEKELHWKVQVRLNFWEIMTSFSVLMQSAGTSGLDVSNHVAVQGHFSITIRPATMSDLLGARSAWCRKLRLLRFGI